MITLSLVIPAYSEEEVIASSLVSIKKYFDEHGLNDSAEVVVVTADSSDNTQQIVADNINVFTHFKHVQPGAKVGKGRDVRAGVTEAQGEYIFFTDADLATPLDHLQQGLRSLQEGADVVIGTRSLSNIHHGLRYYISNVSNILIQLVLLPGVKDSQCGFKGFTKPAANTIFSRLTILGWGFDMEVIKIARKNKYKIIEQPIDDWADPKLDSGLTGESPIKAVIKTFGELWKIRVRSWLGKYS